MALYHKWDVKNDFAYAVQFFSLISDSQDDIIANFKLATMIIDLK